MTSDDDGLSSLLRRFPPPSTGPCPDANLLAAWAERRLEGERLAFVQAHLAQCDACRDAGLALQDESAIPSLSAARVARRGVRLWAIAAAALLAVGAGALYVTRRGGPAGVGDASLVEVAQRLAGEQGDVLSDLKPVDAAERAASRTDATRAGLTILEPAGTILAGPRRIATTQVPGAGSYEFTISDAGGKVLWRSPPGAANSVEVPERAGWSDAPYIVEASATGALGKTSATRTFRVATGAATAGWKRAEDAVRGAEPDLADLLLAHLAVRRGYLLEARRLASAWDCAHGATSPAGRDLAAHARRLLGWPDDAALPGDPR